MLLIRALTLIVMLAGCATFPTFAEERPPRIRHDGERYFVTLLARGRIHQVTGTDGRPIQGIAATIFNRAPSGTAWTALADPNMKQLVQGAVEPVLATAHRPSHRVFLVELEPRTADSPLKRLVAKRAGVGDDLTWLAQQERDYLAKLQNGGNPGTSASVLLVCTPVPPEATPCIRPPRAYTLIIGHQWDDASALKLNAGRQSKPLSAVLGAGFLLGVVWFALF